MKRTFTILFSCLLYNCYAQVTKIDSLKHEFSLAKHDTSQVLIMVELSRYYRLSKPDSALNYGKQALVLSQRIKFLKGISIALSTLSGANREFGNLPKALEFGLKALRIAEENQYLNEQIESLTALAVIYFDLYDYSKYIRFNQRAMRIAQKLNNQPRIISAQLNIAIGYFKNNQLDSSLYYKEKIQSYVQGNNPTYYRFLGWLNIKLDNKPVATDAFKQGIRVALQRNDPRNAAFNSNELAAFYLKLNKLDSCILFAQQGLINAQKGPFNIRILESSGLLAIAYKLKNNYKH